MDQTKRFARLKWYERLRLLVPFSFGELALMLTTIVLIGWLLFRPPTYANPTFARDCALQYERARSAADSAIVDGREPSRMQTERRGMTCGRMRRRGDLVNMSSRNDVGR